MASEKLILLYNATLQKDTEHTVEIDGNGEIILTCVENGHFIKLPAGTNSEGLKAYIEAHKDLNSSQVTVESLEAKKKELLEGL